MEIFLPEHQDFLRQLVAEGIDFILVGGYAVIYHGYGRTTGDLDVWVRPERQNWNKVLMMLTKIGMDEATLSHFREAQLDQPQAIMFDDPPYKVDILTHISMISYEEAKKSAVNTILNSIPIAVLHLHHLVLSKFNTGRSKDHADIEELQRIEAQRQKKH